MTPKEYLNQAYYIDRRIAIDLEKIEAMKSSLHGYPDFRMDGIRRESTGNAMEQTILKVLEYEERINADIDRLIDKKKEIENVIGDVQDSRLREILTRRYLLFQKWEHIASEMHTDLSWVFRLHKRALDKIVIK
nr:MAG: Protein of unknown function (DUF722) [Bacteriophage sp.]